jgi:hypothetical protein
MNYKLITYKILAGVLSVVIIGVMVIHCFYNTTIN